MSSFTPSSGRDSDAAAWIDGLMLRVLRRLERRTLDRLKRRYPEEWRLANIVCASNGDPERHFLRDATRNLT